MKWFVTLSLALLVLNLSLATEEKKDEEKIVGTWQMTKGEMNGENLPEDFVKGFTLTFTKDKKFEAKLADGSGEEGDFKLDDSTKPKSASFTAGGETRKAIYKFDGDELHLCVSDKGGDMPKEFKGDDGNLFFVLKKK